jgi:hypothetical protein
LRQAGIGAAEAVGGQSQAEVEELCPVRRQKYVGGLHVAVNDSSPVKRVQRVEDVLGDRDGFRRRKLPPRHPVLEGDAVEELHDEEERPLPLAEIVDGTDAGMVDGGERLGLAFEACPQLRIRREPLRQHLYGHLSPQPRVPGAVDLSHPAAPQRRDDLVGTEAGAGGERHFTISPRRLLELGIRMRSARAAVGAELTTWRVGGRG